MSTWNVYKIFKSGQRAKSPMTSFEIEDDNNAETFFKLNVYQEFTTKQRRSKYTIIRADLPQEREEIKENKQDTPQQDPVYLKKCNQILQMHASPMNIKASKMSSVSSALVFCSESSWKWQWAAVEGATLRYLSGFSPLFDTHSQANAWMETQIRAL